MNYAIFYKQKYKNLTFKPHKQPILAANFDTQRMFDDKILGRP